MSAREPYPSVTDEELGEVIADWTVEAPEEEPAGMVITDLGAWESAEYDAWCEEMERKRRGEAA